MAFTSSALIASVLCWLGFAASTLAKTTLPVVLWHGMGDSCCNPLSIGAVRDAIHKRYGKFCCYAAHLQRTTASEHSLLAPRQQTSRLWLTYNGCAVDVPVISINTGSDGSFATDMISSFYGNMNEEIAKVCRFLRDQSDLKAGFNMVGFSQGGQFSRALVQRCGCVLLLKH